MRSLASELAPVAAAGSHPRVYVDANIPSGVVTFMRVKLRWDVFFVLEHDDLRRARDVEHFRMARQLGRTLLTLDHDYEDDRLFPAAESAGVLVLTAPDEPRLCRLLLRVDRELFRTNGAGALPLEGRKLHWSANGPEGVSPA